MCLLYNVAFDAVCRQELGFSVFEAGQEMDSFMSGEHLSSGVIEPC